MRPSPPGSGSMSHATHGLVLIHSCPPAVAPHVEWALASILGEVISLEWHPQPALAGSLRSEYAWTGPVGTATAIASALRDWHYLRFEVTEHATASSDGVRVMCTPDLGVHVSTMGMHGDLMIHENRLSALLERAVQGRVALEEEVAGLLGLAWDEELEPLRQAADGAPIRFLNKTG